MSYNEQVYIKPETVDGEKDWLWIKGDTGAWDGPQMDWQCSHKERYLNHVKQRRTVITAGANQGLYARLYSNIFSHVYAFEPDSLNFHCMVYNTQRDNVYKMQCALGEEAGFVEVVRTSMVNTGQHTVKAGGKVPCLPIDAFNFQEVDLIQLDVEGYEFNIMLGAVETIKRCKPVVVMENGHLGPIMDIMTTYGYEKVDQSVADSIYIPKV
jgi:FkbM family methyltransferase